MNCWCHKNSNMCQRCQAAADKKNVNLQIALLEDSVNYLEEIVKNMAQPKSEAQELLNAGWFSVHHTE